MADHAYELMDSLRSLFTSGLYSDLTVQCGQEQHRVHKAIVCPRSRWFTMACKEIRPDEGAVIHLHEDDPRSIELMLHYLYHLDYPHISTTSASLGLDRDDRASPEFERYRPDVKRWPEERNNDTLVLLDDHNEKIPVHDDRASEYAPEVVDYQTSPVPSYHTEVTHKSGSDGLSGDGDSIETGDSDKTRFPKLFRTTKRSKAKKEATSAPYLPLRMSSLEGDETRQGRQTPNPFDMTYPTHTSKKADRVLGVVRSPDRPLPPPSAEIELEAGPATVASCNLVIHTRLYAVADKYEIHGLKALALDKFAAEVGLHWGGAEFGQSVREAYAPTSSFDRGLRDIMVKTIYDHHEIMDRRELQEVIKGTQLAFDLLMYSREKGWRWDDDL